MKNQEGPDIIQQLEQMETEMENIAKVMATYYKELISNGVSEGFAEKIVLDYHHCLWSSIFRAGKNSSDE